MAEQVFFVTLLVGGLPLVARTLWGMVRGHFAADVVAMLASVGAVVFREYCAGAVIVLMQSGGEALETYAMQRVTTSLEALLAWAPKIAHRLVGDRLEDVPVEFVRPGELLIVKPSDLVPMERPGPHGRKQEEESPDSR